MSDSALGVGLYGVIEINGVKTSIDYPVDAADAAGQTDAAAAGSNSSPLVSVANPTLNGVKVPDRPLNAELEALAAAILRARQRSDAVFTEEVSKTRSEASFAAQRLSASVRAGRGGGKLGAARSSEQKGEAGEDGAAADVASGAAAPASAPVGPAAEGEAGSAAGAALAGSSAMTDEGPQGAQKPQEADAAGKASKKHKA